MDEDKKESWLLSDNLLKSSFAVFGRYLIAVIIVYAAIFIPLMIIAFMIGFIGEL